MGTYIQSLDPNHLITTSYAGSPLAPDETYLDPITSITSLHEYSNNKSCNQDRLWTANNTNYAYGKGFIFGELGLDGYAAQIEIFGTDNPFHNALWSTSMMGGFGVGLDFWFDGNRPRNLNYFQDNFPSLKSFFSSINFQAHKYTIPNNSKYVNTPPAYTNISSNNELEYYYLISDDRSNAFGWAHQLNYYWGTLGQNYHYTDGTSLITYYSAPDDQPPTAPDPNPGGYIKLYNLNILHSYTINWYSTTGVGSNVGNDNQNTNIDGRLDFQVPLSSAGGCSPCRDLAFSVTDNGSIFGFRLTNNDSTSTHTPNNSEGFKAVINQANGRIDLTTYTTIVNFSEQITICDILGRQIYTAFNSQESFSIDSRNFARGLYIIKVICGSNTVTKKLVLP